MKLSLLFLFVVSTPFPSRDLALASCGGPERTKTVEFDAVPRYLRANSTSEEERGRPVVTLSNNKLLDRFETLFAHLTHFSSKSVKDFAKNHVANIKAAAIVEGKEIETKKRIFYSLLDPKFLEALRRKNSFFYENYVDIALYLALLESVGGSLHDAAKQIYDAIQVVEKIRQLPPERLATVMEQKENGLVEKKAEYILLNEDAVKILHRMEEGQFVLWSNGVGSPSQVKSSVLGRRHTNQWKNFVEGRYRSFHKDKKKRQIPGLKTILTSRS